MIKGLTISYDPNTGIRLHVDDQKQLEEILNRDRDSFQIQATKQTYVPIHVYKIFLKIALSMIDETELVHYHQTLNFLIGTNPNDWYMQNKVFKLAQYFIPGPRLREFPLAQLYKKQPGNSENVPDRVFVLHYSNFVFQIFLPFSELDKNLYEEQTETDVPIIPLMMDQWWFDQTGSYSLSVDDIGSWDKKKGAKAHVQFKEKKPPNAN